MMTISDVARVSGHRERDWRVWFALASTAFWLWLGFLYVALVIGWGNFVTQPADALGGFLEGAFAPLAFLWLVIGFFLQQHELRQNNIAIMAQYEQMCRTAENSEIQASAIRANALHQQQETTLMIADRVHRQLGGVVGLLWMSSRGPGNPNAAPEERVAELWSRLGSGDPEAFARAVVALTFQFREDPLEVWRLFWGTEVRARHSETIVRVFERLLDQIRACDPEGIIEDAAIGSGHGTVYQRICEFRDAPPPGARRDGE